MLCWADAPVVILANAHAARALPGCESLALTPIRGQVSFVPQPSGPQLSMPVCRDGFITPAVDGVCCLGASYDAVGDEAPPRESDHAANLERLERLLPGFGAGLDPRALQGRVGFRTVTPDRLPLVGMLPLADGRGLFACLGLASRGLTWAPLLGEIIACQVTGEPPPIERDVLRWLAPGRFAERTRLVLPAPVDRAVYNLQAEAGSIAHRSLFNISKEALSWAEETFAHAAGKSLRAATETPGLSARRSQRRSRVPQPGPVAAAERRNGSRPLTTARQRGPFLFRSI